MARKICDIIVIGAGHSGIEAATAAARMGSKVILVTMDAGKIGAMHCNPSVGGLGKGHLAYEVSALGGIMPKLCSTTYLQAKMLNTNKGPAVQGLRLQIDKVAYQRAATELVNNYQNLEVFEGEVVDILSAEIDGVKKITGIQTATGDIVEARAVVITTGTFLNSKFYVGGETCNPIKTLNPVTSKLAGSIEKLIDVKLGRLKTGTPPRILKSSVDFSKVEYQESHDLDYLFEFQPIRSEERAPCYMTHTTAETCAIIAKNMLFEPGKKIGMEPRYCPSLEMKVHRFPDKTSHHVFIEPESLESDEIYPAGISNCLDKKIQEQFLRTIPGFENMVMTKPGFTMEYDFLQPINLKHSLEHKQVCGLFFAGQVNGTTGYEEAAAQGVMAGINAALLCRGDEPFVLSRQNSYIGIMIDDLVSLGVDEPYRMFTSRAERRLLLRQDNVFARLYPDAYRLGLIGKELYDANLLEQEAIDKAFAWLKLGWGRSELFKLLNLVVMEKEDRLRATEILVQYFAENYSENNFLVTPRVILTLHAKIKYDGYLDREEMEIEKAKKYSQLEIPVGFDFFNVPGLSTEMREKLRRYEPKTIAQAQLIPAMTPAAISLLIFRINKG